MTYLAVSIVVLGCCALVSLAISANLQGVIAKPLRDLAATARLISVGKDYTKRAALNSDDEIGELACAFNEMVERIEERDARLERQREELETEVASRTRDLRNANAELGAARDRAEEATRAEERVPGEHEP